MRALRILFTLGALLAAAPALAQNPTTNVFGLDFTANNTQGVSAATHARIRYNSGTNQFEQSLNGAAYVSLSTSTGNWTFNGNNADLTGAGAMGIGNIGPTATSIVFGPTAITWKAATAMSMSAQSATNTTSLTINPNVADGASSVAVLINNLTTFALNSGAAILQLKNNGTLLGSLMPVTNTLPSASDGLRVQGNTTAPAIELSQTGGAFLAYNTSYWAAGNGRVLGTDTVGLINLQSGNLSLTIFQGTPDTDNTRDWGLVGTRWRTLAGARMMTGVQSVGFSATPAFNCTTTNTIHFGAVTANVTGPTMVDGAAGESCTIVFLKDATTNIYTVSGWGANVQVNGGVITLPQTASSTVEVTFVWDSALATPAWVLQNPSIGTSYIAVTGGIGFQNSWVDFGGAQMTVAYTKDVFGFVHLRGTMKSGTVNTTAFTLPVGYRPSGTAGFAVPSNGAYGQVEVDSGGNVVLRIGSNVYAYLDTITFYGAQ